MTPTIESVGSYILTTWSGFTQSNDVGDPVRVDHQVKMTTQGYGNWSGGLQIVLEGSLEPDNPTKFFTLTDQVGNDIVLTQDDGVMIAENVRWIRPKANAGTGGGNVTIHVLAVR